MSFFPYTVCVCVCVSVCIFCVFVVKIYLLKGIRNLLLSSSVERFFCCVVLLQNENDKDFFHCFVTFKRDVWALGLACKRIKLLVRKRDREREKGVSRCQSTP